MKKAKIVVGVVAVGLTLSISTAFAATDAGAQLNSWYSSVSAGIKNTIEGNFAGYKQTNVGTHNEAVNTLASNARTEIDKYNNGVKKGITSSTEDQVKEFKSQINAAKATIIDGIPNEFDTFVAGINSDTDTAIKTLHDQNKNTIKDEAKKQLQTGSGELYTPKNAALNQAKTDLTAVIDATQATLNGKLKNEQSGATKEVNNYLNQKIDAVYENLKDVKAAEVKHSKDKLDQKANELLTDSFNQLDKLIVDSFKVE